MPSYFRHPRRLTLPGTILLLIVFLSGCAAIQTQSLMQSPRADLPRKQELSATPFFPQELYQCGPAALAMTLQAAGIAVTPDELKPQVYIPQREGSLQTEMIVAGRRNGALSMTIPPRLDALLREVAAGTPVVVLQNLSLPAIPRWHYAVVIGFDLDAGDIILRSGTTERLVMPLSTFEHTWARSHHWAMVASAPHRIPVTAQEDTAVPAVVALEKTVPAQQAHAAYAAALQRWPNNLALQLGLGNSAYAAGQLESAASAFRHATEAHPQSAPAFNNLATVLAEQGDFDAARMAANRALALGGQWAVAAQATLESIERLSRASAR
jgi:hypothetical protein